MKRGGTAWTLGIASRDDEVDYGSKWQSENAVDIERRVNKRMSQSFDNLSMQGKERVVQPLQDNASRVSQYYLGDGTQGGNKRKSRKSKKSKKTKKTKNAKKSKKRQRGTHFSSK